jgi:membrane protein DedA with SNARE-associated domain
MIQVLALPRLDPEQRLRAARNERNRAEPPEMPQHLLAVGSYGYATVALAVGLESVGIPLPGEATLIAAAIYAGSTHHLNIFLVVVAASFGSILGDNFGFWLGGEFGFPLLLRFGHYVGLTPSRLKIGQLLFLRHGGKLVFLGRFVAILRSLAAFLAGTNRMAWPRFLAFNAAGGIVWSAAYGFGAYFLGKQLHRLLGPIGIAISAVALAVLIGWFVFLRRNEARLQTEAERAFPGPIKVSTPGWT